MQNLGDTFGQVFRAIAANKLRSLLTMFGIAWGVGSMLLLISVGEGFRSGQHKQLQSVGNDVIMMWGGTIPAVPSQHTGMRPYRLTIGDENAMRASGSFREVIGIIRRNDVKQVSRYQTSNGMVIGTEPNFTTVRTLPLAKGRFLFPGRPEIGESVLLNGTSFEVIGVAAKNSHGNDDGENQQIYVPLTTMHELFPIKGENIPQDALNSIQYQPKTAGDNEAAKAVAHAIIAERHDFDPNSPDTFEEWDTIKSNRMVGKIFDGPFSWRRGDRDARTRRGRHREHHARLSFREDA
jgi:putative ABC transport system permease protein